MACRCRAIQHAGCTSSSLSKKLWWPPPAVLFTFIKKQAPALAPCADNNTNRNFLLACQQGKTELVIVVNFPLGLLAACRFECGAHAGKRNIPTDLAGILFKPVKSTSTWRSLGWGSNTACAAIQRRCCTGCLPANALLKNLPVAPEPPITMAFIFVVFVNINPFWNYRGYYNLSIARHKTIRTLPSCNIIHHSTNGYAKDQPGFYGRFTVGFSSLQAGTFQTRHINSCKYALCNPVTGSSTNPPGRPVNNTANRQPRKLAADSFSYALPPGWRVGRRAVCPEPGGVR